MYIDADAHVDECEETWSYLASKDAHYRPETIRFDTGEVPDWLATRADYSSSASALGRFWFLDGLLFPRRVRDDLATGTTESTRELRDIPLRLKHMDELGVEVQVIFPTMQLNEVTQRPEVEVALYRAYNRWLAERTAEAQGRLRWVAMIPYSSMGEALEEMRFAKENGACGFFKRGIEGVDRSMSDPYLFPAYGLAEELDLAICVHQAFPFTPVVKRVSAVARGPHERFPVLEAFTQLITGRVPQRFPELRFAFIESAAAWLPFLLRYTGALSRGESLADLNFYVTVEADEDIPYIASRSGGIERLIVGTDYSHTDRAALREAHRLVADRGDLDPAEVEKVTSDNARRLYRLDG